MLGTGGQTMRLIEKFSESIKVLNDYRNLYHAESSSTEQYKVANAINDILPKFCELIENDAEPVVRCKDCIYWQDRKVLMKNGEYRDYLPDEDMFVSIDKGINVGSHCTLHGYENMTGSWFCAQANDFCSRGERRNCAKMDKEAEQK